MMLLDEAGAELEGAEAVVVGRSNLFGKPMAQLLLGANATVTTCHSRTRDLPAVCRARRRADRRRRPRADGRARDWVKPGATVIDVGMNRIDDGLVRRRRLRRGQRGRGRDHAGARAASAR